MSRVITQPARSLGDSIQRPDQVLMELDDACNKLETFISKHHAHAEIERLFAVLGHVSLAKGFIGKMGDEK